jgi:hypothetical protein
VKGLAGTGLVLSDGVGDNVAVGSGASFAFTLKSGTAYTVGVVTNPTSPSQSCTVTSGAKGTVANANVSGIVVTCSTSVFSVSGTVSGLLGSGLTLADGLGDTTGVSGTSFSFSIASGSSYAISVTGQPASPTQVCSVTSGGTGTVTNGNVSGITVACTTTTFTVSGRVSGLAGSGLTLNDGAGHVVPASPSGFSTTLASGTAYSWSIASNPTSPWQTCAVTAGATGTVTTANIGNVVVTCTTSTFTVSGVVNNLAGGGLTLTDGLGDTTAPSGGNFAFSLASGSSYAIAVTAQPTSPWQTCAVTSGGTGTVAGGNVNNVVVTCTTLTYSLGGRVANLAGSGLSVNDGAGRVFPVTTSPWSETVPSGTAYSFSINSQPTNPWQTCVVSTNPTGTVTNANVSNVTLSCTTDLHTVSVVTSGQSGPLTVCNNKANCTTLKVNGTTTFPAQASGTTYSISYTPPPYQSCTISSNANGTIFGSDIKVGISCSPPQYPVSVVFTNWTNDECTGEIDFSDGSQTIKLNPPPHGTTTESFNTLTAGTSYTMSATFPGFCGCCIWNASTGACTTNLQSGVAYASGTANGAISYPISCSYLIP